MNYTRLVVPSAKAPFEIREDVLPDLQPHEVRVRVLVAGISFADVLIRHGAYPRQPAFPLTLGYEMVGLVDGVGSDVTQFQLGQRVAALTIVGSYATSIQLPETELIPVPASVDPVEAVSLILNYTTAYQMLHRVAQVQHGTKILVHSAAGGVGTALLELGVLENLEMYGAASKGKHDLVQGLGAVPIDYKNEDFVARIAELTGDGVDVVFDPIGGENVRRSYDALTPQGRVIPFGLLSVLSDPRPQSEIIQEYISTLTELSQRPGERRVTRYSITETKAEHPEWFRPDLEALFNLLTQGKLHPIIADCLPLNQAEEAHKRLEAGTVSGKLVLSVGL